jgi:hypothetical protein
VCVVLAWVGCCLCFLLFAPSLSLISCSSAAAASIPAARTLDEQICQRCFGLITLWGTVHAVMQGSVLHAARVCLFVTRLLACVGHYCVWVTLTRCTLDRQWKLQEHWRWNAMCSFVQMHCTAY